MYGIVGGIWTILLYFSLVRRSYRLYKINKNISYLGYAIFMSITLINIPFTIINITPFLIILIISMLDYELMYENNRINEKKN